MVRVYKFKIEQRLKGVKNQNFMFWSETFGQSDSLARVIRWGLAAQCMGGNERSQAMLEAWSKRENPRGRGDSHMEQTRMLNRNFEFNP